MKEVKIYECDFCGYQTDDKYECKKHEREEHDSCAIECAKSLKAYCAIKRKNNGCKQCYFYLNKQCYLHSQIPEKWIMIMDL